MMEISPQARLYFWKISGSPECCSPILLDSLEKMTIDFRAGFLALFF
jgi:hypothetical protein